MILSDRDLRSGIEDDLIKFSPSVDLDTQLQPASVDLRLGGVFMEPFCTPNAVIDTREGTSIHKDDYQRMEIGKGGSFDLYPCDFLLGATLEHVTIPSNMVARIEGRSSLGRLGVLVHATAGFIDPGFSGNITLEFSNIGHNTVRLYEGMRIAQIVFHVLTSPVEFRYGEKGGKYQGQIDPTISRIHLDK